MSGINTFDYVVEGIAILASLLRALRIMMDQSNDVISAWLAGGAAGLLVTLLLVRLTVRDA